jgi:hypothetical protein
MPKPSTIKGHYWDIQVPANMPVIEACYDRKKDWQLDPRGYFLIKIDREKDLVRVAFCTFPDNVMQAEITGISALDIVNTLIVKDMVSTLQHAADLGVELHKAELALKHGFEYVQDQDLTVSPEDGTTHSYKKD